MNHIKEWAVALSPTKKTNRSLPKGIERFAAFVYNKIAKHHQQESEDIESFMARSLFFCTPVFMKNQNVRLHSALPVL